ncbi:MAG: Mrp/NBP35 family ATP-binding protein [Blautia sp.]|nr:Mrp/NBP35 family ATP-binding protein [Blautia sp.]
MAKECSNTGCDKSSCEGCPSRNDPSSMLEKMNAKSDIKKVIGIVSGKGGVGKSFVTGSIANLLAKKGFKVGILDADITGPSIPRMYGITGTAAGSDEGIYPRITKNAVKIMSVNLLLPEEDAPVIWRGPILAGMVKQFWTDVVWGELDYLLVDMPPGTGDVPLTVFQSIPLNGIIIVTSPQDLVRLIVRKAYNMAQMMNIPVLGIVENYSFVKCPDCGKEIPVFGKSHITEIVEDMGIPLIGRVPVEPSFTEKTDEGNFHEVDNPYIEAVSAVLPL